MNIRSFVLIFGLVLLLCSGASCFSRLAIYTAIGLLRNSTYLASNYPKLPVATQPASNATCSETLNPFIKSLVDQGVLLNSEPVKKTSKCGAEWTTHGTCCQEQSIINYAIADAAEFKENSETFIKEIRNLIKAISSTIFKILRKKEQKAKEKNILKALVKKVVNLVTFFKQLLERLKDLKKLKKTFRQEKDDIVKHQNECVQKLTDLRSASLCNTCSSRSRVFFEDTRARIKMSTCQGVIQACHEYWTSVIRLIDTTAQSNHLVVYALNFLKSAPKTSSIDYLAKWIKENKLKELLKGCVSPEKCSDYKASRICSSLITIKKKNTIITQTSKFVASQTSSFKSFIEHVDPSNAIKVPDNVDDVVEQRRLLVGFGFEWGKSHQSFDHGMFSDVVTVPDSFGVGSGLGKAMNLEHHLP